MKTTAILCLAAALAGGCAASSSPSSSPATAATIPDTSLGLARGSVFDVPTPPAVTPNDSSPGEQPLLARPYAIAPPRVPHGVAAFLPITPRQNACVDCHATTTRTPGEPTPMPPSHYTDLRNAPEKVGTEVAGARHVCVSCHVPKTDAADLVENRFRP